MKIEFSRERIFNRDSRDIVQCRVFFPSDKEIAIIEFVENDKEVVFVPHISRSIIVNLRCICSFPSDKVQSRRQDIWQILTILGDAIGHEEKFKFIHSKWDTGSVQMTMALKIGEIPYKRQISVCSEKCRRGRNVMYKQHFRDPRVGMSMIYRSVRASPQSMTTILRDIGGFELTMSIDFNIVYDSQWESIIQGVGDESFPHLAASYTK